MLELLQQLFKINDYIVVTRIDGSQVVGKILMLNNNALGLQKLDGTKTILRSDDIKAFDEYILNSIESDKTDTSLFNIQEAKANTEESDTVNQSEGASLDSESSNEFNVTTKPDIKEKFKANNSKKIDFSQVKSNKNLGKDLKSLAVLLPQDKINDDSLLVREKGFIIRPPRSGKPGIIQEINSSKTLTFYFSKIIDDELKFKNLSKRVHVIYTKKFGQGSDYAVSIHEPKPISKCIELAEKFFLNDNISIAEDILQQILDDYPYNSSANSKLNEIRRISFNKKYGVNSDDYYLKAKTFQNEKKYDEAIEYFYKAIEHNQKNESAIKDLAMLYAQLFKVEENAEKKEQLRNSCKDLLKKHDSQIPKNISKFYFLENLYFSIQDYNNFLTAVNKLINYSEVKDNSQRNIHFMAKIASAYVNLNQLEEAKDYISRCLKIDPNFQTALKLKEIIDNPTQENVKTAFSLFFESKNTGVSPYISNLLESYNDYVGIPEKIKETGDFTISTLKAVRNYIDKFKGMSRQRCQYLLTEAKLMQILEQDKPTELRSVLAKYCNDMAKNHIADGSSMDTVRFYYNEAFSLEDNISSTIRQAAYYVLTCFYTNKSDLVQKVSEDISITDALKELFIDSTRLEPRYFEFLIQMCLNNKHISDRVADSLFDTLSWRKSCIRYLMGVIDNHSDFNSDAITRENFISLWNDAIEKRDHEIRSSITSIESLSNFSSLDEISAKLSAPDYSNIIKNWMPVLDQSRFNTVFKKEIINDIDKYTKAVGYRSKDTTYNIVSSELLRFIDEIEKSPTRISYTSLLPLAKKIYDKLTNSFEEFVLSSTPKVKISLLKVESIISESNTVPLQISVENDKESSPIKDVNISIDTDEQIRSASGTEQSFDIIDGGYEKIFKFKIQVSSEVIKNRSGVIHLHCRYKINSSQDVDLPAELTLRLYSEDEFIKIDNPYAPIADGGPVTDTQMFYGRDEFISDISAAILKSNSKQIIIYGQKRSGKSSVLYHLRKRLEESGKAFCVSFSMGEIYGRNFSELTFYYKILSCIRDVLEDMAEDNKIIPQFTLPSRHEFTEENPDNPVSSFIKYIHKFKQACKTLQDWNGRKLVVMIDEFTYLYTGIKEGTISDTIMKQWKSVAENPNASFSVVLVGQDVVPTFKRESYASNAFGIIQDIRLNYLAEQPARDLIEKPVLNDRNESRYVGRAVDSILDYTSRNPYYIQIFCSRLIDYINNHRSITITEADVKDVALSFVKGEQALEIDKFDNLIRAGEKEDQQEFKDEQILKVLRCIAENTRSTPYCNEFDLQSGLLPELQERIINSLCEREVVERQEINGTRYRIQVRLFKEWLLNH